jgi:hypothetical protein
VGAWRVWKELLNNKTKMKRRMTRTDMMMRMRTTMKNHHPYASKS